MHACDVHVRVSSLSLCRAVFDMVSESKNRPKMDKLQAPPGHLSLQGNLSENWRKAMLRAVHDGERHQCQRRKSAVRDSQSSMCMACEEAQEVYNTFTWDKAGNDQKVSIIMAKFESYCNLKPRKNVTWERHIFNKRNQ